MLKRINLKQVRVGMFIEAIEGPWVDHPFWRDQFRLDRARDVEKLKSSNAAAVVIDTDKGLDVVPPSATKESAAAPKNPSLKRALETIEQSEAADHGDVRECEDGRRRSGFTRRASRQAYSDMHATKLKGID
jgi:hypothetical protein